MAVRLRRELEVGGERLAPAKRTDAARDVRREEAKSPVDSMTALVLKDRVLQGLVAQLAERAKEFPRTMIFFRWFGVDVDTFVNIPTFHQPWKYIQTIGVSIFNKKVS